MKTASLIATALFSSLIAMTTLADDRPAHFKGEPAADLEIAVDNFSIYNQQLAELLQQKELTPQDLAKIHEMSYTIENALEKINEETENMAITLEEVHLGSETNDAERVQENGVVYLQAAQTLVP